MAIVADSLLEVRGLYKHFGGVVATDRLGAMSRGHVYVFAPHYGDAPVQPREQRARVGKNGRASANYSYSWGRSLLRGRNLNAPVVFIVAPYTAAQVPLGPEGKDPALIHGWGGARAGRRGSARMRAST